MKLIANDRLQQLTATILEAAGASGAAVSLRAVPPVV